MRKVAHRQITGEIHLVSGTRIGGSDELLDIGATDLTVVKHPVTMEPYLPGSSLKGKMRSQLEWQYGLISGNEPFKGDNVTKDVAFLLAAIFGPHKNTRHNLGPTRIIVRDASLLSGGELETKSEVMGDRKTGTGHHPRKMERVVAGSVFRLRVDLQILDLDNSKTFASKSGGDAMVQFVLTGLRLIEQSGLGSGVSRGSGQVEFRELKVDGEPSELPNQVFAE